jgi:AcrR family transcriptional regulator
MLGEANIGRVSRRREATKAEILDAAWDLVAEEGLAGLSLRDLAARVGMRAPSLYQYFDSKHAIYDAMFGQGAREALEEVDINDGTGNTRELMRASAHKMFDFVTSNPARSLLLFQRTIPGFEPSAESYAPAVALIERLQTFLAEHGITDPAAQDTWTAMVSGLSNQQLANDPGGTRWARLIDRAVDMYLAEFAPHVLSSSKKRRK